MVKDFMFNHLELSNLFAKVTLLVLITFWVVKNNTVTKILLS